MTTIGELIISSEIYLRSLSFILIGIGFFVIGYTIHESDKNIFTKTILLLTTLFAVVCIFISLGMVGVINIKSILDINLN
jgi:hypothetical protein